MALYFLFIDKFKSLQDSYSFDTWLKFKVRKQNVLKQHTI